MYLSIFDLGQHFTNFGHNLYTVKRVVGLRLVV